MIEQPEDTKHLLTKVTVFYGHGSWHPRTITVITSKITDTDYLNKYSNSAKCTKGKHSEPRYACINFCELGLGLGLVF